MLLVVLHRAIVHHVLIQNLIKTDLAMCMRYNKNCETMLRWLSTNFPIFANLDLLTRGTNVLGLFFSSAVSLNALKCKIWIFSSLMQK